jgi:hypothetical protein
VSHSSIAPASLLWEAPLPASMVTPSRQLWVNDQRARRAHATPDACSGGPIVPGLQCAHILGLKGSGAMMTDIGYSNVTAAVAGLPPLNEWLLGAELIYGRGGSGASWTEPRCGVTGVARAWGGQLLNVTVDPLCWNRARTKGSQSVTFPTDAENALALLNEPGEWYADWAAKRIYYAPRAGETLGAVDAWLGGVPSGSVRGESLALLQGSTRVHFSNIGFRHVTWLLPSMPGGYVDLQSGYYFTGPTGSQASSPLHGVPGALGLHGVRSVSISNCTFEHLGLSGVLSDGGSQRVDVRGSRFFDLSGSAISVGNVSHAVLPPEEQDGNVSIVSNVMHATGAEFSGCAGVVAGYVAYTSIVHNDLSSTSNGAVCLGWGWGAKNTMRANNVSYNRIVRSNTVLFDCGSIYTLSEQPESEVSYNYIEDQVLLYGSLYHDARSAGFHTHHNVVVGGPMWLYLQWGALGAVYNITIEDNFYNQTTAGGCADPEHADTCNSTGWCPAHYPPATCGNVIRRRNTLVNGTAWPVAALAIKERAGPDGGDLRE